MQELLQLAAKHNIRPMTEIYPLEQANEVHARLRAQQVRFRAVLTPGLFSRNACAMLTFGRICSPTGRGDPGQATRRQINGAFVMAKVFSVTPMDWSRREWRGVRRSSGLRSTHRWACEWARYATF